jgi:hypothetical protein
MLRIALPAVLATLALAAPAHAAPGWLPEEAPFGEGAALQFDADASMAPDGTVVAVRFTPDNGDAEVVERPPGGPARAPIKLPRVLGEPRPGENLEVLTGADGTAAVLYDAGNFRFASVRRPGRGWSDPEIVALRGGTAILAPDGELWAATRSPAEPDALWVTRLEDGNINVIPLPEPPDGFVDQAPAIAVPRAGSAHVVFVQAKTTDTDEDQCTREARIISIDTDRVAPGPATVLDAFTSNGAGRPCQPVDGAIPQRPKLVTSDDGSDTVAYTVQTFADDRVATLARHREPGGEWGRVERLDGDPNAVLETLVGGRGAPVLAVRAPGGLVSVTTRGAGGDWPEPELIGASPFPFDAARTGAGTTVFAWTNGARVRASVVERDGEIEDPVAIAPAQDLLGLGGDAFGDAVVLYSRPAGDTFALRAAGFDATPPRITDVGIPERGRAGLGLPFIVSARDVWGPLTATWDFGDGTKTRAIALGHEFAEPGDHLVSVVVTDAAGNATGASGHVLVGPPLEPVQPTLPAANRDTRAPRLSKLGVHGRTLTLTTDEGGVLTVHLSLRGHHARMLGRTIRAGRRSVTLPRLAAGAWRATIRLTDAAGNRTQTRLTVRVKPPRTRPRGTRAA